MPTLLLLKLSSRKGFVICPLALKFGGEYLEVPIIGDLGAFSGLVNP